MRCSLANFLLLFYGITGLAGRSHDSWDRGDTPGEAPRMTVRSLSPWGDAQSQNDSQAVFSVSSYVGCRDGVKDDQDGMSDVSRRRRADGRRVMTRRWEAREEWRFLFYVDCSSVATGQEDQEIISNGRGWSGRRREDEPRLHWVWGSNEKRSLYQNV